jgi:diketogulonate reductase-like aldo/keto reductase
MAAKYARSPAQILGRWCVQHNFVYLSKSEHLARMKENIAVFDFVLDAADMAALDALTTPESLAAFKTLYQSCVVRDTPLQATNEGVKADFTLD